MLTKKKKYILAFLSLFLLILVVAGYYLYQQIYDPENLKKYFIVTLSKLIKTPVSPPDSIEISLLNNTVSIGNWSIKDSEGKKVLELSQATISFQKLLFGPKIRSIDIEQPKFFVSRYPDGSFNFEIFREQEQPKIEKKPQEKILGFQKSMKSILYKEFHIAMHNAWIGIESPDVLKKQIEITDINLQIQNEPSGKLFLFERKHRCNISLGFFSELTQKIFISGYYDFEEGIHLAIDRMVSFSLEDILDRLKPAQNQFQIKGNVKLTDFKLGGLSPSYPEIYINGSVVQDKGSCFLSDFAIPLSNIQSKFTFIQNQIQNIFVSANFHQSTLKIVNGSFQHGKNLFLLLEIQDLSIDQNWVLPINHIFKTSSESYWNELAPKGKIQGTGILTYEEKKGWDWSVSSRLSKGKFQYNNIKIENIDLNCQIRKEWLQIEKGSWKLNKTTFSIQPNAKIYFDPLKIHDDLVISFKRFLVDKAFLSSTPELGEVWELLQPEGTIDGKITFRGNPLQNLPTLHARCYDMKAKFNEIPYPVLVSFADLVFQEGCLSLNLEGQGMDCPSQVKVKGEVWIQEKKLKVAYRVRFQVKNLTLTDTVYKSFSEEKDPDSWLKDIQSIWDHLQPSGLVNIEGKIVRPRKSPHPPDFDVVIQPCKANVCYKDFPYPVTEVEGQIRAKKGIVTLSSVKAKKNAGDLEISGKILTKAEQGLDVDLSIAGKNIPVDDDLQKVLGPSYKGIWEDLSPKGDISLSVNVSKKAHEKEVSWQALATLQKVSLMYKKFPYPIEKLSGEIKLSPGRFSWDRVSGFAKESPIQIKGWISEKNLSLQIIAKNLALDKDLYKALPEEGKKIAKDFSLKGKISIRFHLKKENLEKVRWSGEIEFEELQGKYHPFPFVLNHIRGKVKLEEDKNVYLYCKSQEKDFLTEIEGIIKEESLGIHIKAKRLAISEKLFSCLPVEYQNLWKSFSPSGIVDMEFVLQTKGKEKKQEIHIYPRHCSLKYKEFPYPIQVLMASPLHKNSGIHIYNSSVEFFHLLGYNGKTSIEINGSYHSMEQSNTKLDLKIQAENIAIDKEFRYAIAQTFPTFIKTLQPEGKISKIAIDINRYEEKQKTYLKYSIQADQIQSTMKPGQILESLDGNIQVSGYAYDKEYHVNGEMEKGSLSIKNFKINNFFSKIKFFHDYLLFYEIQGNFYEGELQGSLVLDVTPTGAYKGFFTINKAHLDKISIALKKKKDSEPTMWGSLNGEMAFQGNSYSSETMTGKGKIQLSNGVLWEFPIFLALLDLFSLPSRPAFRSGDMQFSLSQNRITIHSMRFDSSLLSISGKGTVDFDTNLNLLLMTHFSPSFLPSIPLVDKLWNQISHGFLAISVKGTLEKPAISMNLLQ